MVEEGVDVVVVAERARVGRRRERMVVVVRCIFGWRVGGGFGYVLRWWNV